MTNETEQEKNIEIFGEGARYWNVPADQLTLEQKELAIKAQNERDKDLPQQIPPLNIEKEKRTELTERLALGFMEDFHVNTIRSDLKDEIWVYSNGIYVKNGRSYIREYCREQLGEEYTPYLVSDVMHKVAVDSFIDEDEFFAENSSDEIAIQNGILNLRTHQLSEFTHEKKFFNKQPVVYDPEAKCPGIHKHLIAVLKNPSDKEVIFELFGFCLYKEHFVEKAFMFLGDGRNGKGKTIELLKNFLGAENCSSVPLQQLESEQFARSELFKKFANLCGDLSRTALKTTGIFKQLTGRDLISADRKFLPRIHFKSYAKLVFACNELPRTGDLTPAFWNRWILLEFPFTFLPKKELDLKLEDPKLTDEEKSKIKLADVDIIAQLISKEELSGLLNEALNGLDRLLKKKDFSFSKSTADVKQLWLRKSDSLTVFITERVEQGELSEDFIPKIEFKRAYALFCRDNNSRQANDKEIKGALLANFEVNEGQLPGGKRERTWEGVRWKIVAQAEQLEQGISNRRPLEDLKILVGIDSKNAVNPVLPVQLSLNSSVSKAFFHFIDGELKEGLCSLCGFRKEIIAKSTAGMISCADCYQSLPGGS